LRTTGDSTAATDLLKRANGTSGSHQSGLQPDREVGLSEAGCNEYDPGDTR